MKSSSPPPAPDPAAQIAAQGKSNRETAIAQAQLNQVNQLTPYGSLTYEQIGTQEDGTPKFQATTALSEAQQGLLGQQEQFGGLVNQLGIGQTERLAGHLDAPVDLSNEATEAAILERYKPRFEEREAEGRDRLETLLIGKGLRPGSEAYDREVRNFSRSTGDSYNQLLLDARRQAVQEALTARNQPINEITALMSGGQVSQPGFQSTPQTGIEGVDVAGINQQDFRNQMGLYNQKQSQRNAMMGGLAGLGGAALQGGWMMSDVNVKEDIKKVGKLDSGPNIYKYKYKGSPIQQLGVMAQEVEQTQPEAVAMTDSGYKAVNYEAVAAAA